MTYKYVRVSSNDKIAVIEFNYQQKLNALSEVLVNDIIQALNDLTISDAHCIILRAPKGAKVYSAGHDINELPETRRDPLAYGDPLRRVIRTIQQCPKPVIAMVEGSVWGGAFEMVMSADIVIACSTSTFAMTPANLGVPYNLVGTHNLTRDAGLHIIKEMIFTAAPLDAQRALAVGLINHVLPAEQLEQFTMNMARVIAEKASAAIAVVKEELRVLGEAHPMNPDEFERIQAMRRAVYDGQDYQEGLRAFMEKRKPIFSGN